MVRQPSGGAPKGNQNARRHGQESYVAQHARLVALGKAGPRADLPAGAEQDMIVDWSRTLAVTEKAFSMRVFRLGSRLAQAEALRYPGLNGLDPLGRISLIALQGLMDSIEARQVYALSLRQRSDPAYFKHQYLVAVDIRHAYRLRQHVIKSMHDATPVGDVSLDRLLPNRRRA